LINSQTLYQLSYMPIFLVGTDGNDPSELKSAGFTVRTVSLTVYAPKIKDHCHSLLFTSHRSNDSVEFGRILQ
jgi:hypothetical protein